MIATVLRVDFSALLPRHQIAVRVRWCRFEIIGETDGVCYRLRWHRVWTPFVVFVQREGD